MYWYLANLLVKFFVNGGIYFKKKHRRKWVRFIIIYYPSTKIVCVCMCGKCVHLLLCMHNHMRGMQISSCVHDEAKGDYQTHSHSFYLKVLRLITHLSWRLLFRLEFWPPNSWSLPVSAFLRLRLCRQTLSILTSELSMRTGGLVFHSKLLGSKLPAETPCLSVS